jgi:hypothetical protein
MGRYFFSFGRPRDDRRLPELRTLESCVGESLVSIPRQTASIECGFEEDTIWQREIPAEEPPRDPSPDAETGFAALRSLWQKKKPLRDAQEDLAAQENFATQRGLAALKLSIHAADLGPKPLHRLEHVFTFSQTAEDKFHSIHRCWPSALRGTPNFTEQENEVTLDPSAPTPLGDARLGGWRHRTQRSEQSNWTVGSQRRPSRGTAGGRYDEFSVYWAALQANDLTTWASRPLYSSAVLRCGLGPLTITATVYGYKSRFHFKSGGRRVCKKILGCSSVRFDMSRGHETDVDTLCAEVASWTNDRNDTSVRDVA